jgi:hypothetical protein
MKTTYLTPTIIDGVALEKPETAAQFFVRGLKLLLPEHGGSLGSNGKLTLREAPDKGRSTVLTDGKEAVVLIGLGMFFQQDSTQVAKAMVEALCKVADLTEEETNFRADVKAAGLTDMDLGLLASLEIEVLGSLEVYDGYDGSDLDNTFTYHAPKTGQTDRYEVIRDIQRQFAEALGRLCPQSRELDNAMDRLNEVGFWANASIARNEDKVILPVTMQGIVDALEESRPAYEAAKADLVASETPVDPDADEHDPKWEESRDCAEDPEWAGEAVDNALTEQRNSEAEVAVDPICGSETIIEFPTGEPKPE